MVLADSFADRLSAPASFDGFDKLGQAGPFFPIVAGVFIGKEGVRPKKVHVALSDLRIAECAASMHAHKDVKMISHQTETQYFGKVQPAEVPDQLQQLVVGHVIEGQAIQRRARHHVVDRWLGRRLSIWKILAWWRFFPMNLKRQPIGCRVVGSI